MPMIEEEIDGLSGLLFPFYDADTHMLYLAGKVRVGEGLSITGRFQSPSEHLSCLIPKKPNLIVVASHKPTQPLALTTSNYTSVILAEVSVIENTFWDKLEWRNKDLA